MSSNNYLPSGLCDGATKNLHAIAKALTLQLNPRTMIDAIFTGKLLKGSRCFCSGYFSVLPISFYGENTYVYSLKVLHATFICSLWLL